ncbi:MAG: bifunctional proline dehydrogenase/L-glutamate gamma-semialdehyde dehydrogenase PutA, partial [Pseudomonadota bacterium]
MNTHQTASTILAERAEQPTKPGQHVPSRDDISAAYFADEAELVRDLCDRARVARDDAGRIATIARSLVDAAREGRRKYGHIDAFLHQYGLTTEEGIILMCLAEALLRIPDAATADALIDDKISSGNWERHLGKSDNAFVNASSWGLMLTGEVMRFDAPDAPPPGGLLGLVKRITKRTGEPIIRQAMRHAMRIMGDQFVLGRTIEEAQDRAFDDQQRGVRFSYDMLGEAAKTMDDAERYYRRYVDAIESVGRRAGDMRRNGSGGGRDALMARPGISVKLSAIHPRFEPSQRARLHAELVPNMIGLVRQARARDLAINIDAEEQDRLDLTLDIFAAVMADGVADGWDGFGMVVQAYGRRAMPTLRWLREVAKAYDTRIPVRLVKGAYWDTEIKHAQELGLESYPVFTRKVNTDVSYLACARLLLAEPDVFYPQFATHNAHTIAAIHTFAGNRPFEFQRLHGMGEAVYERVLGTDGLERPVRVYAPVGSHDDLLAYLVRRLLENGANSSFVNRLADDEAPVDDIIAEPVVKAEANAPIPHPDIPPPAGIFLPRRKNAEGFAIWDDPRRDELMAAITAELSVDLAAGPIVCGATRLDPSQTATPIASPTDNTQIIGHVTASSPTDIEQALVA